LRALMDKALNRGYVLLPLAAPHRPPGRAGLHQALDRASSLGPLPAAVEATPRMTHEQSAAPTWRPPSTVSHELPSGKHKSRSLAGIARTAASGVKQQSRRLDRARLTLLLRNGSRSPADAGQPRPADCRNRSGAAAKPGRPGGSQDSSFWAIGAARDSAVGAVRRHLGTSIDAPRGLLLRSGR
jgi:hypothetical protein